MTDDARPDAMPGSYLEQVIRQRDEARAERDSFATGVPLICCDERHEAKVRGLEALLVAGQEATAHWEEAYAREVGAYGATERALSAAEARIAAALAVVERFDEYLLRRDAVADLRDALNGTGGGVASLPIRSWADHAGRACADAGPCPFHDSPARAACCVCKSSAVAFVDFRGHPFCWPCASGEPHSPEGVERDAV